jgi:hypothetical protein
MFLLACLLWLLFGGAVGAYSVLFLPVSALTALWVRQADLVVAPMAVPIAFAIGLVPISGSNGGFGAHFMGLVTSLALHAGWLYSGTLIAGLIVGMRRIKFLALRRRARALKAPAGPQGPKRRMPTA